MEVVLLTVALIVSLVASDKLIRTYLKTRARRLACKAVAGAAMSFYSIALALFAYGYLRGWSSSEDSNSISAIFKTAYFFQHIVPATLTVSIIMHLDLFAISLVVIAILILVTIGFAITIVKTTVLLENIAADGFNAAFSEPLPSSIALTILLGGTLLATALYLYSAYKRGTSSERVPYLITACGLVVLAIAVLTEDFSATYSLWTSALKLLSATLLSYGLISIKPAPSPLC
ncbi:MAG: hypothetical protein QXH25_00995 [Acidilobaceae archaeon]